MAAVIAGSVLVVGSPVSTSAATPPAVASTTTTGTTDADRKLISYRVRPGDTVTGLAVRWHAWTAELRSLNHLGRHGHLRAGQRIRIPVVMSAWRKAHPRRQKTATDRDRVAHRPRPWRTAGASRAQVRRVIVRTARRQGVNPQVALAVAWQESGWQQRRISSAGAIGAMQVMPGTGRWMSLYTDRRLNLYSLHDNVTAGVMLLKVLRGQTTTKRSIAAYYQGLRSVRKRGMYPSTKEYTRNVVAIHRRIHHGWRPA